MFLTVGVKLIKGFTFFLKICHINNKTEDHNIQRIGMKRIVGTIFSVLLMTTMVPCQLLAIEYSPNSEDFFEFVEHNKEKDRKQKGILNQLKTRIFGEDVTWEQVALYAIFGVAAITGLYYGSGYLLQKKEPLFLFSPRLTDKEQEAVEKANEFCRAMRAKNQAEKGIDKEKMRRADLNYALAETDMISLFQLTREEMGKVEDVVNRQNPDVKIDWSKYTIWR